MIEIEVKDGSYIVKAPKCVLVLTKAQFIEALQRGKAYRRVQQRSARLAPSDEHNRGDRDDARTLHP
jgi:hypothetical protein